MDNKDDVKNEKEDTTVEIEEEISSEEENSTEQDRLYNLFQNSSPNQGESFGISSGDFTICIDIRTASKGLSEDSFIANDKVPGDSAAELLSGPVSENQAGKLLVVEVHANELVDAEPAREEELANGQLIGPTVIPEAEAGELAILLLNEPVRGDQNGEFAFVALDMPVIEYQNGELADIPVNGAANELNEPDVEHQAVELVNYLLNEPFQEGQAGELANNLLDVIQTAEKGAQTGDLANSSVNIVVFELTECEDAPSDNYASIETRYCLEVHEAPPPLVSTFLNFEQFN